jgi:hypothetical protein
MSWKGPKCPVCSGRMVQAWVDAGHTRHGRPATTKWIFTLPNPHPTP